MIGLSEAAEPKSMTHAPGHPIPLRSLSTLPSATLLFQTHSFTVSAIHHPADPQMRKWLPRYVISHGHSQPMEQRRGEHERPRKKRCDERATMDEKYFQDFTADAPPSTWIADAITEEALDGLQGIKKQPQNGHLWLKIIIPVSFRTNGLRSEPAD